MTRTSFVTIAAGTLFAFAGVMTGCGSDTKPLSGDSDAAVGPGGGGAGGTVAGGGGAGGTTGGNPGQGGGGPGTPTNPRADAGPPRGFPDGGLVPPPRNNDGGVLQPPRNNDGGVFQPPRLNDAGAFQIPDGGFQLPGDGGAVKACTPDETAGKACTGSSFCLTANAAGTLNGACYCVNDKLQCPGAGGGNGNPRQPAPRDAGTRPDR